MTILAAIALVLWLALLLVPWRPWSCRERLEPDDDGTLAADEFTILIPARNEAAVIADTLDTLAQAAPHAPIIVIDDQSDDQTADIVHNRGHANIGLLAGTEPPAGWSGKLWALEQGLQYVQTRRVLLMDADIRMAPGLPAALLRKAKQGHALVSVLAEPCWQGFWARWLLPAYVYFFKLVYPFALANKPRGPIAAAAGGIALVDCRALHAVGGFDAWRDAIIDDCSMAQHFKRAGYGNFLGLSHGATSSRRQNLPAIIAMVARSAYVQLHESKWILAGTSVLMLLLYAVPVAALACAGPARWLGLGAWCALTVAYLPTLHYYARNRLAAPLLPVVALLYLGMTWFSALRHMAGTRSAWKGRRYLSADKD